MDNDERIKIITRIICELLTIYLLMLAYNAWIAYPMGLYQINYLQAWVVRLIGLFFTSKLF